MRLPFNSWPWFYSLITVFGFFFFFFSASFLPVDLCLLSFEFHMWWSYVCLLLNQHHA
ncbi:hypothetical protein HanLR1_Chr06g0218441 [Helianthus annuus]|nr:hypothetical protein HanHA89_Chr06g0234511 [Helianthus annuus]KAJ0738451.1 hypothetical protein HanLR1_Chr06g0218441 [Helianthus annuus]